MYSFMQLATGVVFLLHAESSNQIYFIDPLGVQTIPMLWIDFSFFLAFALYSNESQNIFIEFSTTFSLFLIFISNLQFLYAWMRTVLFCIGCIGTVFFAVMIWKGTREKLIVSEIKIALKGDQYAEYLVQSNKLTLQRWKMNIITATGLISLVSVLLYTLAVWKAIDTNSFNFALCMTLYLLQGVCKRFTLASQCDTYDEVELAMVELKEKDHENQRTFLRYTPIVLQSYRPIVLYTYTPIDL